MKGWVVGFFDHINFGKEMSGMVELRKEDFVDHTDKKKMFVAVKVRYKKKLKKPIKLNDIKKNSALKEIPLIKQSRLSVMPIDSKSWKILNNMSKI